MASRGQNKFNHGCHTFKALEKTYEHNNCIVNSIALVFVPCIFKMNNVKVCRHIDCRYKFRYLYSNGYVIRIYVRGRGDTSVNNSHSSDDIIHVNKQLSISETPHK